MTDLTNEEQKYLDKKFDEFQIGFWKKFRLPAIGLAVVFAGLVAVFASYLYMQARVNVMNSQVEMTKAVTTFYDGMHKANEEIKDMVDQFNILASDASRSVSRMKRYEAVLESIAKKHSEIKKSRPAGHPNTPESDKVLEEILSDSKKAGPEEVKFNKDMFNIQQKGN